jgi:hypothetical protein
LVLRSHDAPGRDPDRIASARQHLPELVSMAVREPQRVYRRDKLVAAVVSPKLADQVEALRRPNLAMKLAELQRLCTEENYELTTPPRTDRPSPLSSRAARGGRRVRRGAKR